MPKRKKRTSVLDLESNETMSLIIAVIVTTVIFAYDWKAPLSTIDALPLSFLAVLTAFLFHELAHRFTAKKLNCSAVYRLWIPGVIFGLLMMLVGVKLIIVGAVVIGTYKFGRWGMKSRRPSIREIGFISVSGPLTNLVLVLVFKLLANSAAFAGLAPTLGYLATINLWIAFFNLMPIKPLDGSKVFFWNPRIWLLLVLFSLSLFMPPHIFGPLFESMA
jgi:Zn-dependent protease